jgi:hypothetical protein
MSGRSVTGDRPLVELALCDKFTRSALVESGDYIAAVQNESRNGTKQMKGTGKERRSHEGS